MNVNETKKTLEMSPEDLAMIGDGALGYIREIEATEAKRLLGKQAKLAANTRMFCLYHADGKPVSISGSREAAIGSAAEHELLPMSVH